VLAIATNVVQGGQVTPVQVKDQNRCEGYPARVQGYPAQRALPPGWVTPTSVLIFDLYGRYLPPLRNVSAHDGHMGAHWRHVWVHVEHMGTHRRHVWVHVGHMRAH
jgi:hypothetical protein